MTTPLFIGVLIAQGTEPIPVDSRVHYHNCPECYEAKPCKMDCTLEPDLFDAKTSRQFGPVWICDECEAEKEKITTYCGFIEELVFIETFSDEIKTEVGLYQEAKEINKHRHIAEIQESLRGIQNRSALLLAALESGRIPEQKCGQCCGCAHEADEAEE